MMPVASLVLGTVLLGVCIVLREPLESDPVGHMLVLLPLLAIGGCLLAVSLRLHRLILSAANATALTLVSIFIALFWMLPRYIDASLTTPAIELAKFISIPAGIGAVLTLAWPNIHPLLRGAVKCNCLSMLGVLAFAYSYSPMRICNSYLVSDQQRLGMGFLIVACVLAIAWAVPLFLPQRQQHEAAS